MWPRAYVHSRIHPGRIPYPANDDRTSSQDWRFDSEVIDLGVTGRPERSKILKAKSLGVFMRKRTEDKTSRNPGSRRGELNEADVRDRTTQRRPVAWQDDVVGLFKQQTMFKDKGLKPGI